MFMLWPIQVLVQLITTSTAAKVPGIVLESSRSSACTELPLEDIDNFVLCFFLQLKNGTCDLANNTVFKLVDDHNSLELKYSKSGQFAIDYRGRRLLYPKLLEFYVWTELGISVRNGSNVTFEVNNRITRNIKEELISEQEITKIRTANSSKGDAFSQNNLRITKPFLCAGDREKSSIVGSLAGITLKNENETGKKNTCLSDTSYETFKYFKERSARKDKVSEELYSKEELCWGTKVFLLLEGDLSFNEHSKTCLSLKGQLLTDEEVTAFSDKLKNIYSNKTRFQKDQINYGYTWIHDDKNGTHHLDDDCPVFDLLKGEISKMPCIGELNFNFCLIPKYLDFYYYGALKKYDKYYTLEARNHTLYLKGNKRSWVQKENETWVLRSKAHREFLTLHNSTVPVGRNTWESHDQVNEYNLTFTNCGTDKFTCSNSKCVPRSARCNGRVECLDASDEDECRLINKMKGYAINQTPPPREMEPVFTIKHYSQISGIDDISSVDGIANVDAYVTLTWYDPRITFLNPVPREEVECSDIWHPELSMADGVDKSFQINFKPYRSSCILYYTEFDFKQVLHNLEDDPYMGRYSYGKDVPITYVFSALIKAPCRFDLKKYPFGTQPCNIVFWADNAFLTSNYSMQSHTSKYFVGNDSTKELEYFGRETLGEYNFLGASHMIELKNRGVLWTFKMRNLFGFHLVNSFTPSFLMFLVSYSTLFFPILDFNERIMVSLTALLVLAALFTQASNTSVRTPYFKYLDVWYVSLITFCFFIVIANVMVHKLESLGKKNRTRPTKTDKSWGSYEDVDEDMISWFKKVERINRLFEGAFAIFFFLFLIVYCLGAADTI